MDFRISTFPTHGSGVSLKIPWKYHALYFTLYI